MVANYPLPDSTWPTNILQKDFWLKETVTAIRNIRGGSGYFTSKKIPIIISRGTKQDKFKPREIRTTAQVFGFPESITWKKPGDANPLAATAIAGSMELLVPMENLIDKETELSRLTELAKKK